MRESSPLQGLIDGYKQSPRPVDRFVGRSMWEMLLSGKFRGASRSPELKNGRPIHQPNALVMTFNREDRLQSTFQILDSREDLAQSRSQAIGRLVEDEWTKSPEFLKDFVQTPEYEDEILRLVAAQGLQTLAGIYLSTSAVTGQELFEFFYPEFFKHPDMPDVTELPEDDGKNEIALAIAVNFLRKFPFGSGKLMRIND